MSSALSRLIGPYHLYQAAESDDKLETIVSDQQCVQEEYMKKLVLENFGTLRDALNEALSCEDYEEEGLQELSQLHEAITSVNEDLEGSVLDYMLFYIFSRSENQDNMCYRVLLDLLDSQLELKARSSSATRRYRPESSSPDKLKIRNAQKAAEKR